MASQAARVPPANRKPNLNLAMHDKIKELMMKEDKAPVVQKYVPDGKTTKVSDVELA